MLSHMFQGIKTASKKVFQVLKNDALKYKHQGGCARVHIILFCKRSHLLFQNN